MASKPESESKEVPNSRGKYIVPALLFCLGLSVIGEFVLSNKLETRERNNEVLAQEMRRFENRFYQETKKDVAFLEETREVLRECLAVYKAQP